MFSVCLGRKTPLNIILRTCAGSFALVFAYSCGYNLLLLTAPLYLLQIYDRVLSSRSTDTLVMLTLIVIVTVVVGGLLDAVRRIALGQLARGSTGVCSRWCSGLLCAPRSRAVRRARPMLAGIFPRSFSSCIRAPARRCSTCSGLRCSCAFFFSCTRSSARSEF